MPISKDKINKKYIIHKLKKIIFLRKRNRK